MQNTNRFIGIGLITCIALGGIALAGESNPLFDRATAMQKLLETGVESSASSASTEAYAAIDAKRKEIYTWFDTQKKQIQSDADAVKKAINDQISVLSETEKQAQRESFYAQFKQLSSDTEARMKDLQAQMDGKMNDLKTQYLAIKGTTSTDAPKPHDTPKPTEVKPSTTSTASTEAYAAIDAKRKEIYTWFDTQKKQIQSDADAAKKALYDQINGLSETEKQAQRETFYAKFKQLSSDTETKMKSLQTQMDAKMNDLKTQYLAIKGTSTTDGSKPQDKPKSQDKPQTHSNDEHKQDTHSSSTDKDTVRQEMKDKLSKVPSSNDSSSSVCKASFDTLRSAREASEKTRKAAWTTFWDANKGAKKDIFTSENRDDVKDTLDTMRIQIRLVERKYAKSLVATSSTVTLEYALSTIDAITTRTRTDLAEYVQDGKMDQFNTFRDGYLTVLRSNKRLLLTLMQTQAQTIGSLNDSCKQQAKIIITQPDQSDKQSQSQLNSVLNGGSTEGTTKPQQPKTQEGHSSTIDGSTTDQPRK